MPSDCESPEHQEGVCQGGPSDGEYLISHLPKFSVKATICTYENGPDEQPYVTLITGNYEWLPTLKVWGWTDEEVDSIGR
jgi:hypothetical protein